MFLGDFMRVSFNSWKEKQIKFDLSIGLTPSTLLLGKDHSSLASQTVYVLWPGQTA